MKKPRLLVHVSKTATQKPQKIAQEIKWLIFTGQLKAGDQLPSVRAAAEDWNQSKDTVHRAFKLLLEENVIADNDERGTHPSYMVSMDVRPPTEQERQKYLNELLTKTMAKARKLGFSVDEIERMASTIIKRIKPKPKTAAKAQKK